MMLPPGVFGEGCDSQIVAGNDLRGTRLDARRHEFVAG